LGKGFENAGKKLKGFKSLVSVAEDFSMYFESSVLGAKESRPCV